MMRYLVLVLLLLVASVSASPECRLCESLANDLLSTLDSNSTYTDIYDGLLKVCTDVFRNPIAENLCDDAVKEIVAGLKFTGMFLGKGWSAYGLCTMLNICDLYCCILPYRPEQVHISITGDPSEMIVTFVTGESITPQVEWGETNCMGYEGYSGEMVAETEYCEFPYSAYGESYTYTQGSWQGWIHRVKLTGLQPSTTYYYRVGDPGYDWSTHNFNFTTIPTTTESTQTRVVAFGDMDAIDVSDVNVMKLQEMAQNSDMDLILHCGDISYADGFQATWDDYMRKVEFFAAYVPYMAVDGNHEIFYNFTSYKNRFNNPGNESLSNTNMYFSYNYGQAHFIAFSLEETGGIAENMKPGGQQYNWLEQDLIWASNPTNRTERPWIIMYAHRPLYCSSTDGITCGHQAARYRSYMEELIQTYRVDLVVQAHVHYYERTLPVYNNTVASTNYNNPPSATYVVVGSGGNREGQTTSYPDQPLPWSVYYTPSIGLAMMKIDYSTLVWEFMDTYDSTILDTFTITKNNTSTL